MGRQETLRERAEDLARQTVAALPDDREAAFLLAEVLTRAGKWPEARTIIERLANDPDAEPGTYGTGFCAAAVVAGKTNDVLEIFAATGANERWRPLYEALRAVQAGSPHYLRRVAPEVRHLAERLLKQIQPDLGS